MTNVWALIVELAPTDDEPTIRNINTDDLTELLAGEITTHTGNRLPDGNMSEQPRIRFHTTTAHQQPGAPVNWIATLLWRYYNHGVITSGQLRGATVIITGHDPDTDADTDLPEDAVDTYVAIAEDYLAQTA